MRKSVKELEVQLSNLQQNISDLHRTIDEKEHQTVGYVNNLNNNSQDQISDIFRQMDSRFDKMENKISGEISNVYRELDKLDSKSPDLLKG
jgi:DNA anti-recombination protein RmuC